MKTIQLLKVFSISFILFSCHPEIRKAYRKIAGDTHRSPGERKILLQEASVEAPARDIPPPPPKFDSTGFKNHISQLEQGLQSVQEEYSALGELADSLYRNSETFKKLKALYLRR